MTLNLNSYSQGLLKWVRISGKPLLVIKPPNTDLWIAYHQSKLAVPDHGIPGESKGFATAQKLLKLGYVYDQPTEY